VTQLHTATHIMNALVFQQFDGALVTGAQMNEDSTARMDFDLPDADNDRLRGARAGDQRRHPPGPRGQIAYVPMDEAAETPACCAVRSVTPPPGRDGRVRIVEIVGSTAQACGGTHLVQTGACGAIKILKIERTRAGTTGASASGMA